MNLYRKVKTRRDLINFDKKQDTLRKDLVLCNDFIFTTLKIFGLMRHYLPVHWDLLSDKNSFTTVPFLLVVVLC